MIRRKERDSEGTVWLNFKWEGIEGAPEWFKKDMSSTEPEILKVFTMITNQEEKLGAGNFYVLKDASGKYSTINKDEFNTGYEDIQSCVGVKCRTAKAESKIVVGVPGSLRLQLNDTAERKVSIEKYETTLNDDKYTEHDLYHVCIEKDGETEHAYGVTFQKGTIPVFGRNGMMMEELIEIIIDRIETLNGKFQSDYNEQAITHLKGALSSLEQRTRDRIARDVEGKEIK